MGTIKCRAIWIWVLVHVALTATWLVAALDVAGAGQMGLWSIRSQGRAAAQTLPYFRPVLGSLLHIRADADSTAVAESEPISVTIPYRVTWWLYVTGDPYDDLVVYQAADRNGEATDVTIMCREARSKLPEDPSAWRGVLWVEDAKGCRSEMPLRRPGWHRFAVARRKADAVDVLVDGTVIGSYDPRSLEAAERISVGDPSSTDGFGEAYWSAVEAAPAAGNSLSGASPVAWRTRVSGAGQAEQGTEFWDVVRAHLYLGTDGTPNASCEAEWGAVAVRIPYHFWCQVYVSEKPYHSFTVLSPLDADRKPTDLELEFHDPAAENMSEGGADGFVWVTDAAGRHCVGSITRGSWHEIALTRRGPSVVDLLIDGRQAGSFTSRSANPVARYRFGDFGDDSSEGEAYWYKIRLVPVPKE